MLGAILGGLLFAGFWPKPVPIYREVQVPVERIREVERVDTIVTWRERIVYRTPRAEQVAVAVGGAQADVARFCPPPVTPDSNAVTPERTTPVFLLRSVRLSDGWFLSRDQLTLTGPLSNGDLAQRSYRTRGSFQAATHADSVIVQYPRAALFKQFLEFGSVLGAGFVLGRLF